MPALFYLLWNVVNKSKIDLLFYELSALYLKYVMLTTTFLIWCIVYFVLYKLGLNLVMDVYFTTGMIKGVA